MKNHYHKRLIIGYTGKNSVLAKSFIKDYNYKFKFKCYSNNIKDNFKLTKWFKKNSDINIFINFAAITSPIYCNNNKDEALLTNFKSVVNILNIIQTNKLKNFNYFLTISSSHVFKKSFKKLNENSAKKPSNFYGVTKLNLEKFILQNSKKFQFKIGIARIFNYYNYGEKKGFFINDIIDKLNNSNQIIHFNNINTYRDFISMKNINTALYKMISLKLTNDFNICSGQKIYLPNIIDILNKKFKNKKIIFDKKKLPGIIGSNIKLKRKGWKIKKDNFLNDLLK